MKKPSRFSRMCLWTLFIFSLSLMLCTAASYGQTPKVIGVAGGGNHTVILKDDGSVWTFGRNDHGQLGCGDIANRATPVRVRDPGGFGYLTGIKAVAAGENHTLALATDGIVWAWGANNLGQLGIGNTEDKTTPVRVHLPVGVQIKALATGYNHNLALATDGTVYAWGNNSNGQSGDNPGTYKTVPNPINGLTNVKSIAAGENHSAALVVNAGIGTVKTWGSSSYGQLGNGKNTDSFAPVSVQNGINGLALAIDAKSITLALDNYVSSTNDYYKGMTITISGGWNGTGTITKYVGSTRKATVTWVDPPKTFAPTGNYMYSISTVNDVTAIACGKDHTLAVTSGGTAWAWGYNGFGQLGDGTTVSQSIPVRVSALSGVVGTNGGEWHSLFLKNDGTAWACGRNDHRQLGNTSAGASAPVQVKGLVAIVGIDAGNSHNLALMPDGKLYAWGSYQYGQIGDSATADSATPLLVETNPPVPTVISTDPVDNARDVVPDKIITVTLSTQIQEGPYYRNIVMDEVTATGSPNNLSISTTIKGSVLTVNHSNLDENKKYRIYIPAYALKDANGNLLEDSYTFSFNTRDNACPTVTATSPKDGAGSGDPGADPAVDVTLPVSATFSEDMDPLTINENTFVLCYDEKDSGGNWKGTYEIKVDGIVTYNAPTQTATFIPINNLLGDTNYRATITNLASDLAGNRLVEAKIFSFTTDNVNDPKPFAIVSHSPGRNETDVVLDKTITVTFSEDIQLQDANKVTLKYADATSPSYSGVSIDDGNKIVRIRFSGNLVNNTADIPALKANITFAANGTNFAALAAGDDVAIIDNTLAITFNTALAGNANKIKIAANSLKDAAGNVLNTETITDPIDTTDYDHPPAYHGATIDATNRIVTLKFSEDLENNTINIAALKANITFAANGTNFAALAAGDNVAINNNTLVVTFATPLTGNRNKIKIAANSLKDTDNPAHVLGEEVTTDEIVAAEPEIDVGVDAIHEDQLIITLKAGSTLDDSTTYNVTIQKDAVTDKATKVKELANAYSFKFTTVSDNIPPDIEGIYSEGLKLDNYASDIAISSPIVIKFTKSIQECNLAWDNISLKAGDIPVGISKSINGNILTITSLQNLDILTIYTLTLPANCVMDMFENKLAAQEVFIFTTGSQEHIILKAASDVYGIPGKTVEVPVTVENGSGLTGFQFALGYEVSKLKPVGVAPGNGLSFGWQFQYSKDSGRIIVTGYKAQGNAIDKDDPIEVVRISFLILDGVAGGDTLLNFGAYPPSLSGVNKTATTKDGKINIVNRQLGDVNGDGFVNVQDTMLAIKFIMGEQSPEPLQKFAADVNSDGVIDVLDVVQIVNISLGR